MTRWSARSLGSKLQHSIFYALIRLGGRLPAYALLFLVVLYYTAKPSVRARSRAYRRARFPGRGRLGRLADAFRLNFAFGKVLVDRAVLGITGSFEMVSDEKDKAAVRRAVARGKGLIMATAHVGSWQSAMSGLDFIEAPKYVVMVRDAGDVDRHFFEHGAKAASFAVIDPRGELGGAIEMTRALTGGGVVCLMADRLFGRQANAVTVDFLGRPLALPVAPYLLASATGAPVAAAFSVRTGPGRARIFVSDLIEVPAGLGRAPGNYAPYAKRFARALEAYVAETPYQFFNFYDFWHKEDE